MDKNKLQESLNVLGLDPGSRVTGYGVVEMSDPVKPRYRECGVIRISGDLLLEKRLLEIADGVRELIKEFKPICVAVEDVFVQRNVRSALKLGHVRGALLLTAAEKGLVVHSYSPAVVKKTVTGRGRASKAQIQRMVQVLMGLERTPASDASDALAVALCHVRHAWRDVVRTPGNVLRGRHRKGR